MDLDETDHRILSELAHDARASMSAVARAAHVSRAGAYARVNRMVEAGVITGFTTSVDPVKAGLRSSAYVALSLDQAPWQQVRDALTRIPEVKHIALVGGEVDILLLVRARDNHDLRRVVLEQVQAIPSVRSTKTWLVFEDFDPAQSRAAVLDAGADPS